MRSSTPELCAQRRAVVEHALEVAHHEEHMVSMSEDQHSKAVWAAFGRALGADPRDHLTIRRVSRLDHAVEGISVDDKGGRVIIIAAESSPRIAALMQIDVEATMPDAKVLVARPVVFDLPAIARGLVKRLGPAPSSRRRAATARSPARSAARNRAGPPRHRRGRDAQRAASGRAVAFSISLRSA